MGQEVTVGGEQFFVLEDSGTTLKLLSKYCLLKDGSAQTDKNGTWSDYGRAFSRTNHWSNDSPTNPFDLQSWDMIDEAESDGDVKTGIPNAVLAARDYGTAKGGTGRLMTYQEATTIRSKSALKDILFGTWTGTDAPTSGYIDFWLGNARDGTYVWVANTISSGSGLDAKKYNTTSYGVRPVITISK